MPDFQSGLRFKTTVPLPICQLYCCPKKVCADFNHEGILAQFVLNEI